MIFAALGLALCADTAFAAISIRDFVMGARKWAGL